MDIKLTNVGKKFGKRWIFRNVNLEIPRKSSLAVKGSNGSGKSTLLQIMGGLLTPTEGRVHCHSSDPAENSLEQTRFNTWLIGPEQQLIEELTIREHLAFHFQFREATTTFDKMLERAGLDEKQNTVVGECSSGMKQRLKLALAFYTKSDLLLMDEPTSFLDSSGIDWYQNELEYALEEKTIIVASNQKQETQLIQESIDMNEFSPIVR